MSYWCYIIYSKNLDRYYTGATANTPEERLVMHNQKYYSKSKFTAAASDWVLFIKIECNSYQIALKVERHIKKMKSRKYIENLKKYPEIINRLANKYQGT